VFHPSHFTAVLLFALYCFVLFVGAAIVLSWVMFLIAR